MEESVVHFFFEEVLDVLCIEKLLEILCNRLIQL